MVVVLMTGSAFAAGPGPEIFPASILDNYTATAVQEAYHPGSAEAKIIRIAEKANDDVEKEIVKAQKQADKDKDLDRIIEKLLEKTERIISKAIGQIEKLGGEAECVYVEVLIGDRLVLVDPLRIVRL